MDVGGIVMYSFEWDQNKSKINQSKHGVTYGEVVNHERGI